MASLSSSSLSSPSLSSPFPDLSLRAQNFLPRGEGSLSPLVSITACEHQEKIILRADDKAVLSAIGKFFGTALPRCNKTVATKGGILLWLGPNEILYRTEASLPPPVSRVASLETRLRRLHVSIVDVSDYYVVARVSGVRSRVILQKNCPLDFDKRAFAVGDCAQSLYGKAAVLFSCVSEDTFFLQFRISLSDYLWSLLSLSSRSERAS